MEQCREYSICFEDAFWNDMLIWATAEMDLPACLVFLQHTFPSHFRQVTEEVVPLREQAAQRKLQQDRCWAQLRDADQRQIEELTATLRRLAAHWFPEMSIQEPSQPAGSMNGSQMTAGDAALAEAASKQTAFSEQQWQMFDGQFDMTEHGFTQESIWHRGADLAVS